MMPYVLVPPDLEDVARDILGEPKMTYVAVVYKHHADTFPRSHKPNGDYSCFVANNKDEAVRLATIAIRQWEGQHPVDAAEPLGATKFFGPYTILVGRLTETVRDQFFYAGIYDTFAPGSEFEPTAYVSGADMQPTNGTDPRTPF